MHQTFSGASRRPRQVNLSGRPKVSNPFAPSSGAHNALQNAQQERERRQRERDRLNAASLIQRSWRRYTTRKELAAARRQSWDERELEAAEPGVPPTLEHCRPYATESEAFSQLDLLLRFLDKSDRQDILRMQLFLARLALLSRQSGGAPSGGKWPGAYLRLQHTILAVIQQELTHNGVFEDEMLLEGLLVAIEESSDLTAQHAARLYRHLGAMLKAISKDPSRHQLLSQYTLRASLAPLKDMTAGRLPAYEAFAVEFLTLSDLTKAPLAPECLNKLADEVNYKLLAKVLATSLMPQIQGQQKTFSNSRSRANLLASLIYFYRLGRRFQISFTDDDYMIVVSTLLNSIASVSGAKKSASEYDDEEPSPFTFDADGGDDAFVQEQINSLADSDSIDGFLGSKSVSSISGLADMDEHTEHIASFALTLLRFFPHKGDEVRIRLYMASGGVDPDHPSEKMPAIRYFWKAARASRVFNDIRKDADSVIPLLKSGSRSDGLDDLQDSWRVILIFMELYSFVLKLMDDEEFFSHADSLRRTSTWASQNALPLDEVSDLTLFLKNLGFVLYFDAASIRKIYGRPRDGSLSSYFSPSQSRVAEPSDVRDSEVSIAGLAGIGIDYVKGLVTGLLRMLYERDSRRQFLPNDHWLMTSRFDMQSFIPSVVEEEQNRHRIEENDEDDEEEDVSVGGHAGRTVHLQRLQRQQRQLSRQRQMQAIAPRLEILQNMPFFIPFETRVRIFREFVALDKETRVRDSVNPMRLDPMRRMMDFMAGAGLDPRRSHHARIRRTNIFDDAYNEFNALGEGLKDPIQITFVDAFNQDEAGIDGGGVTKEFLTSITHEMFTPSQNMPLFVENEQHLQYPNPVALDEYKESLVREGVPEDEFRRRVSLLLSRYEFLGRIIGKCLYEGILVDVAFAGFFLLKWALTGGTGAAPRESGYRANINDVRELDEELYQGLLKLKNYPGDVSDFGLDFTIADTFTADWETGRQRTITRELKPGGAQTPVTNDNRLVYVSYVARHRLQAQPYRQTAAFLRGLGGMVQPSWLNMFNRAELQTLIGGASARIDVDDLRRNTQYGGTYVVGDDGEEHPTVKMFWRIVEQWGEVERRALLKFVTSTPRAPLLGFAALKPSFSIRDSGQDQTRLPSTSTCVNLLKLPMYTSEAVLREKLHTAVFSGAGFDLS